MECGTFDVAENPEVPDGRRLGLYVARWPATADDPLPDPLFLLAGGPGQAASEAYGQVLPIFERIHRDRDIVLVDQRGTGLSAPLDCTSPEGLEQNLSEGALAGIAKTCRAELQADLTQYSTERAADDLEAVRVALGYARINVLGASYGTRLALELVRRHPAGVRSVVLDGVAPRAMLLPLSMAADGQRALDALFARCAADDGCKAAFGDLATTFREVTEALPQKIDVRDPRTGEPVAFTMTKPLFSQALRGLLYSPELTALLPLALAQAKKGDFQGFIAEATLLGESSSEMLSLGLFLSVVCGEDVARITDEEIATETRGSFLGRALVDDLRAACDGWPKPTLADDFAAPVVSDVPVLLLSGTVDPVTPPRWGDAAAKHLSMSRHLTVPGASHGTMVRGCTPSIIRRFIAAPSELAQLDAACLDDADNDVPPFFIDFAGPAH